MGHIEVEVIKQWFQGISAFPDGDNLLSWIGTVEGPKESVYEGLTYKLRLEFPAGKWGLAEVSGVD